MYGSVVGFALPYVEVGVLSEVKNVTTSTIRDNGVSDSSKESI